MRHSRLRGILSGLCAGLLCGMVGVTAAAAAEGLGFAAALGAGATAWVDPTAALFENPGRLALLTRGEAWSSLAAPAGSDVLHVALAYPLVSGPALGIGLTRSNDPLGSESLHLGGARGLRWGLAAGAALTLQTQSRVDDVQTSFGLDLGLHWRPLPRFEAGVAVANAIEPRFPETPVDRARELRIAAAWTQPLDAQWSTGLCFGARARAGGETATGGAALLRRGGATLALGADDGAWRAGAALAVGPWRLDYAYGAAAGGSHDVAVLWRFGSSRDARRASRSRQEELEIAARTRELATVDASLRAVACSAAAESALAQARYDDAAALFAALLVLEPQSPAAQAGLRRSRHAQWVQMADSLLVQHETAPAIAALQQALRVVPEDSVSARRLQELRAAASTASRMQDLVAQRFGDGLQAYAQQRYLDAVRAFQDVLRLDPEHDSAAASLRQAQTAHAVWRKSMLQSARQRYDAGDDTEAAAFVRRLLDVEPRHAEAQKLLARLERRAREAARPAPPVLAAKSEDAAPVSPVVAARYAEGMQLFRGGDLVGAMQAWEEVSRQAPHYDEVDRNLLRVYRVTGLENYTEGRLREAIEIWEKALRLDPGNEQLRRYVNQAHEKLKRTQPQEAR